MLDREKLTELFKQTTKDIIIEDEYGMELLIYSITLDNDGSIIIKTEH